MHEEIQKIIEETVCRFPRFGVPFSRCRFHNDSALPFAAAITADYGLAYNPTKLLEMPSKCQSSLLVHELLHVVFDHHARKPEGCDDHMRWNIACDCEINSLLRTSGFTLFLGAVFPEHFGLPQGQLAEYYYAKLPESQDKNQPDPQHGSSTGGEPQDWESGMSPLNEAQQKIAKLESQELIKEWEKDMRNADCQPGDVSSLLSRLVERFSPVVKPPNWQTLLRHALSGRQRTTGCDNYTWAKKAKRAVGSLRLPALVAHLPQIGIVMDTSGSIDDNAIAVAFGHLKTLIAKYGTPHIVACDTKAVPLPFTANLKTLRHSLKGGGGTDLRNGINALRKYHCDYIVIFTDGYTLWPDTPPKERIIIVINSTYHSHNLPAWAKVIHYENPV